MLDVVFGENSGGVEVTRLRTVLQGMEISGTFYLGYPVLSTADGKIFVDALLVSGSHGLVAFDVPSHLNTPLDTVQIEELGERQNQIYASLYNKLNMHRNLRKGRSLAVAINVITCHPAFEQIQQMDDMITCAPDALPCVMGGFDSAEETYLRPLHAAIQRVSTLRPPRRRENVKNENSRGAILKKIEQEIANLDQWQNRAAIEYANGPQRIRGLAGSGKTVVLALKASYLHVRHPDWKIAVTFQTRSLYQQFRDLIRRFTFDQIQDEPDWSNLVVMHGWGSARSPGIYSLICSHYGIVPRTWRTAQNMYPKREFAGICEEVNKIIDEQDPKHIFDTVLVDEAQDFPAEFFRMIYRVTAQPHRIIWAYDDLQNLGSYEMRSEHELFGAGEDGKSLVALKNNPDRPKEDIVLPVCYRNTPWALSTAHALGFGIYRQEGLIQMFKEPSIWPRIGYEVVDGNLALGHRVSVRRGPDSYPPYFTELLDPEDAILRHMFKNDDEQYRALAEAIEANINEEELEPNDILVVLPDAFTFRKTGAAIISALYEKDISAHLVGVTNSRDELFQPDSVAVAHVYRAKGNEAAMVYVLHAEFCQSDVDMDRKRNILFTALTRSRCWVRLFGIGQRMQKLCLEVDKVKDERFKLEFDYPDQQQIERLATVHRDMKDEERSDWERKIDSLDEALTPFIQGDYPPEALPPYIHNKLIVLGGRNKPQDQ